METARYLTTPGNCLNSASSSPIETDMPSFGVSFSAPIFKKNTIEDTSGIRRFQSTEKIEGTIPEQKSKSSISKWLKPRLKAAVTKKDPTIPYQITWPIAVHARISEAKDNFRDVPDSPAYTDCSESMYATQGDTAHILKTPLSLPELRRIAVSYQDLRHFAAQQNQQVNVGTSIVSPTTTSLLPSPVACENQSDNSGSYFRIHKSNNIQPRSEYSSYEDLRILSCYYDQHLDMFPELAITDGGRRDEDQSLNSNGSLPSSDDEYYEEEAETYEDDESTASEPMPQTPIDRTRRNTICSDESDWLANTNSYRERQRRFRARCFQVVQHPMDRKRQDGEGNGIMLATVLVGPGKPKLIQIQRPSSGSSSEEKRENQRQIEPTTPEQHRHREEISAFSPYDTPGKLPKAYSLISHEHGMKDPFQRISGDDNVVVSRPMIFSSTTNVPDVNISTPKSPSLQPAKLTRNRKLHRMIRRISVAIEDFKNNRSTSNDLCSLLTGWEPEPSNDNEEIYKDILGRIFTDVNDETLSCLTTWLVIDVHLSRLMINHQEIDELDDFELSKIETLRGKVRNNVGRQIMMDMRNKRDEDIWISLVLLVEVIMVQKVSSLSGNQF